MYAACIGVILRWSSWLVVLLLHFARLWVGGQGARAVGLLASCLTGRCLAGDQMLCYCVVVPVAAQEQQTWCLVDMVSDSHITVLSRHLMSLTVQLLVLCCCHSLHSTKVFRLHIDRAQRAIDCEVHIRWLRASATHELYRDGCVFN